MADGHETLTWWQWWKRQAAEVLWEHPVQLSEFLVGMLALGMGITLALAGSPAGSEGMNLAGGIAFALFGAPQMVSAVHGSVRWRHFSNVLGFFASVANLIRTTRAEVPIAMYFFLFCTLLCAFFWWRTHLDILKARKQQETVP